MDFKKVKGYNKLTADQQAFFQRMFNKHQAGLGNDAKIDYTPVSVKAEKGYLRVVFKNGIWLHYSQNGTWY